MLAEWMDGYFLWMSNCGSDGRHEHSVLCWKSSLYFHKMPDQSSEHVTSCLGTLPPQIISCQVKSLGGPPLVGQWWSSHCEHFCSRKVHSGELCLGWSWKILKCRHWKPVPLHLLIKRSLKFIAVGKCQDSQVRKRMNGWNSRHCWFEVTTMYLFGPIWV